MDAQQHRTGRQIKAPKPRRRAGEVRIGTSGWHYDGWWGPFFPKDVKKKDALAYYASRFEAVELNATFYRTPTPVSVENWAGATPAGFRFAWKASKFITHWRRLKVDRHSLELLDGGVARLGDKAGPILFQLPPRMKADRERLAGFIDALEGKRRYAFEFRNASWYEPRVLELLADRDMALCISDHADAPAPREATAGWVYIRNHGPSGRYHGSYDDEALDDWASAIRDWRDAGRDVWCFFDNDVKSAAPADAERLARLVDGSSPPHRPCA